MDKIMVQLRDGDYMKHLAGYVERNLNKGYTLDQIKLLLSNPETTSYLGFKTREAHVWNIWRNRILAVCSKLDEVKI